MPERKEELKSFLMKVKEKSEKRWLKTQHSKNEDHGIWSLGAVDESQTMDTVKQK